MRDHERDRKHLRSRVAGSVPGALLIGANPWPFLLMNRYQNLLKRRDNSVVGNIIDALSFLESGGSKERISASLQSALVTMREPISPDDPGDKQKGKMKKTILGFALAGSLLSVKAADPCIGPWASVFRATNGTTSVLWTNTTGTNCIAWCTNTSAFLPSAVTKENMLITRAKDGKAFCSGSNWNAVATTPGQVWRFTYERNPVVTNGTWSFSLAWHN